MNILVYIFHRHTFDPEKWVLVNRIETFEQPEDTRPCARREVYKNTCLTCGDLVVKSMKL